MGRLENVPEQKPEQNGLTRSAEAAEAQAAEAQTAKAMLRSVTQDLRSLQQDLLMQLNQDVSRLQAEKSRLVNDIEQLQTQQQALQSQQAVNLSQQQLAQQQAWAKQLALVLANHLQTALNERLNQTIGQTIGSAPQIASSSTPDQPYQVMASLDDTVNRTFASLRHDINSYQSSLGQQLERMHTMGQQGEAILEVLVKRLSQQLQAEARANSPRSPFEALPSEITPAALNPAMSPVSPTVAPPPAFITAPERLAQPRSVSGQAASGQTSSGQTSWTDALKASVNQTLRTNAPPIEFGALEATDFEINFDVETLDRSENQLEDESAAGVSSESSERQRPGRRRVSLQQGLGFVLLSTVVMSLHYVGVGILGNASQMFGQQAIGGYLSLEGFSNAALLLWIRMLVVVPVMLWLATQIHPSTLRDLRAFTHSGDRRGLWGVLGSGIFLFLSQVLLYLAIGKIGPGVAIATLFIYPVGAMLLNGLLFAERPSLNRIGMVLVILVGVGLAIYPLLAQPAGVLAALLAALAFTFYLTSMQLTARKLHPVPVSLVQFASMFVLSSLSLIVLGIKGSVNWSGLLVGGAVLGLLTVGSYLLNHFGIRAIGAARASIIASSTPALTALLGFFLVPGALTTLNVVQIVGILTVTLGGTALGLERMLLQNQAVRQAKLRELEPMGQQVD